MQPLNFDVPIDVEAMGINSEDLLGRPEREAVHKYWDKMKQAIVDFGIDCYRPFTREHRAFLLDTSNECALIGGNSSAKTWTAMAKVTAVLIGRHPTIQRKTPAEAWVACEDFSLNKEGPLKALLTLGQQYIANYSDHSKEIEYKNGSKVTLKSYESGWKKFQSAAVDIASLDEEPPEEIYKEIRMRTLRTSGHIQLSMTPLEGLTWTYDMLYEDPKETVKVYTVSLFDNYTLKEEDIERTISGYSDQEREARVYGRFTQMAGLVYPEFKRGRHVIAPFKLNKNYVVFTGIDPHITTPTAVVYYAVGKLGDHYVIGEQFLDGSIPDIAKAINAFSAPYRQGWSVMDSSAQTEIRIFDRDIYSSFIREGINALLAPKGPGSIGKGISDVRELLKPTKIGIPTMRIFDNCKMLIKSMQTLTREQYRDESKQGKKDKVAEGKHHHHAALRYIHQLGPRYFEPMVEPDDLPPMDEAVGY